MTERARLTPAPELSAEDLLRQALSLSRGLHDEELSIAIDLPEGATRPLIEPMNRIDEHIFFALFEFVPGMYGEDDDHAMARDKHFMERFGDLPLTIGLSGTPPERFLGLLAEIRRKVGAATIHLDATEGDDGEFEAVEHLEGALGAITDSRRALERITQHVE